MKQKNIILGMLLVQSTFFYVKASDNKVGSNSVEACFSVSGKKSVRFTKAMYTESDYKDEYEPLPLVVQEPVCGILKVKEPSQYDVDRSICYAPPRDLEFVSDQSDKESVSDQSDGESKSLTRCAKRKPSKTFLLPIDEEDFDEEVIEEDWHGGK